MILRFAAVLFALFLSFPAVSQDSYIVFEGTESPDGRFALGWGVPYEVIDLSNPDKFRETLDFEAIENYVVDLNKKEIMAVLPSTYFEGGGIMRNHGSISSLWRQDSEAVVVVEYGKWGFASVAVLYVDEPDREWERCSDAIPLGMSLNRMLYQHAASKLNASSDVIDGFVFSADPEAWEGAQQVRFKVYGEVPKDENAPYYEDTVSFLLPGPQLLSLPGEGSSAANDPRLITANSVGPIEIGMTVGEARQAMPGATFRRTSDGEGISLIAVREGVDTLFTLFADEWDPDAPINDDAVVQIIDVSHPSFKTDQGIHPGAELSLVESHFGKLKQLLLTEIESREYADFEEQPSGYSFQVTHPDGWAGDYYEGETLTKRYVPGALIHSIEVSGLDINLDGRIGGLGMFSTAEDVWVTAGKKSFGQVSQGEDEMWEAFGQAVQTWSFPNAGVEFDMISDEIGGDKTVFSITVTAPSDLVTARGVGIGSTRSEVESAYSDFPPDPEGYEGYFDGQDVYLVGSIYGGMIFTFENGVVSKIFFGASAE